MVALYNKAERLENAQQTPELSRNERMCHARTLADIVSYIEDTNSDQTVAPVFQMPELTQMYHDRLKQMGIDSASTIHSTRLKKKTSFWKNICPALKKACENDDHD